MGPAAPDFSNQIHDFNPGINPFPSGLFWTIAFDDDSVQTNFGRGTARYRKSNLVLKDFHDIPNSLVNGPSELGTVSFDVRWSGVQSRGHFTDAAVGFTLDFVHTGASISWSGRSGHPVSASFRSTAVTRVNFAEIARERNGVFLSHGDGENGD